MGRRFLGTMKPCAAACGMALLPRAQKTLSINSGRAKFAGGKPTRPMSAAESLNSRQEGISGSRRGWPASAMRIHWSCVRLTVVPTLTAIDFAGDFIPGADRLFGAGNIARLAGATWGSRFE